MTRLPTIATMIDDYWEQSLQSKFRDHLGPSDAGTPCDRSLWLRFRWAVRPIFPGRIKRLFARGQREEDVAIMNLQAIGVEIASRQEPVSFSLHVRGSADGVISSGVPGARSVRHVLEIKTHNKKSFDEVEKKGAPEEHRLQMDLYMLGLGINRSLYYAVCKDDDRLFVERYELRINEATKAMNRLCAITLEPRIPTPISHDPTWWQCKMCSTPCHTMKIERNCRTCLYGIASNKGWSCGAERQFGELCDQWEPIC